MRESGSEGDKNTKWERVGEGGRVEKKDRVLQRQGKRGWIRGWERGRQGRRQGDMIGKS